MRILANENFPGEAVKALRSKGHDVVWVRTDAPGSKDRAISDLNSVSVNSGSEDLSSIGKPYRLDWPFLSHRRYTNSHENPS